MTAWRASRPEETGKAPALRRGAGAFRITPGSVVFATSSLDNLNRLGRTSKLAGARLDQL
ncbi:hypothetical protein JOE67_002253 [Microbacterium esteraromaticum]|nr:hypothetical protein [Microbacterium esteraromaticum]